MPTQAELAADELLKWYARQVQRIWQMGYGCEIRFDPRFLPSGLPESAWVFDGAANGYPGLGAATLSGFSAYRQIPALSLGWNLAKNGGFQAGSTGWTLHANASVVADATSPSGYSLRLVATAAAQDSTQGITIEAATASSYAVQMRSDGAMTARALLRWLDASGTQIGADVVIASSTSSVQTEYPLANQVAPGNARTARLVATSTGAGIAFFSCFRVMQQPTAPAAWVPAHQVYFNQGACVYEAATNLIANGITLSGAGAQGFYENFGDLSQWADAAGWGGAAAGGFTLAASVASGTANQLRAMYLPQTNEWWDHPSPCNVRVNAWRAGGFVYVVPHWNGNFGGAENSIRLWVDGSNAYISKIIGGVSGGLVSAACALVDNTAYWMEWSITSVGTTMTVTLKVFADSPAGTKSATQVGTTVTTTFTDAAIQTGMLLVGMQSGANPTSIGGAGTTPANPLSVLIPGVTSMAPGTTAGKPIFIVSKTVSFLGAPSYSLAIAGNYAGSQGYWTTNLSGTITNAQQYSTSVRCKRTAMTGAGAAIAMNVGGWNQVNDPNSLAGAMDWFVLTQSSAFGGVTNTGYTTNLLAYGIGLAHFDLLGMEQKAYQTLNSDPTGLAYTTGARSASSFTEALETGFNIGDFSRTMSVRLDHAYNAHGTVDRWLWAYVVDANNYIGVVVVASDGSIRFRKVRAGITSEATDGFATAFAAGDSLVITTRHSASIGLELNISKNGGAVATYTQPSAEAKNVLTGTPTNYIGRGQAAGNEMDGTIGIDRHSSPSITSAQVTTNALSPMVVRRGGLYSTDHVAGQTCVQTIFQNYQGTGSLATDEMAMIASRDVQEKLAHYLGIRLTDANHLNSTESCDAVIRRLG